MNEFDVGCIVLWGFLLPPMMEDVRRPEINEKIEEHALHLWEMIVDSINDYLPPITMP